MLKKIIFFIFFFYVLILIQTSFLVQFNVFGIVPNLILMAIILINIFTSVPDASGLAAAFIGGIYLDIFSPSFFGFFGFYTLVSLLISLLLKFILKNYVKIPRIQKI